MTTLRSTLSNRKNDFNAHLALAQAMDQRLFEGDPLQIGDITLSVRHLMTIKSGLIIHLYNIVEAVMTCTIKEVGSAVRSIPPEEWANDTLKEWLRCYASTGTDGNEESRLVIVHKAALKLLAKETIEDLKFKKPSGTWSDKVIYTFSKRLNVQFRLTEDIARKIRPNTRYGDKSPLEFLADRRNAIAHGRRSFEDGAADLALQDIQDLAETTTEYMELAVTAFQSFLDDRKFVADPV